MHLVGNSFLFIFFFLTFEHLSNVDEQKTISYALRYYDKLMA